MAVPWRMVLGFFPGFPAARPRFRAEGQITSGSETASRLGHAETAETVVWEMTGALIIPRVTQLAK